MTDSTGALLPGASVSLDTQLKVVAGSDGSFVFHCVPPGKRRLTATAGGFKSIALTAAVPFSGNLRISLMPSVQEVVTVTANGGGASSSGGAQGLTVSGEQLQTFADDPDDLQRQLQQLGAYAGGSPTNAVISVNGFLASSALPPKDSIAFVQVAPDMFSSEFREPPLGGTRVEVFTKPGASAYHGSIFLTNSSHWMNAADPFSGGGGSIGKQRYGFTLTGPIVGPHASFALALEHRSINEVSAVNALVPGPASVAMSLNYAAPTPQSLWEGSARVDLQWTPRSVLSGSYQANVATLANQGVGGNTLLESGWSAATSDHALRFSNVTTVSPKLIHETRYAAERIAEDDLPNSSLPQQQISGFFTGGGASIGLRHASVWVHELDDDIMLNTSKHFLKAGVQGLYNLVSNRETSGFNGTFLYSGYVNSLGTYVSPLEQYQAAQSASGVSSQYTDVSGTPQLRFFQAQQAFFFEDSYRANTRWSLSFGARYAFETLPAVFNGLAPRGGIKFSPDVRKTWELDAHVGLFHGQVDRASAAEQLREDGRDRITSLAYQAPTAEPLKNQQPITSYRTQVQHLTLPTSIYGELSVSKELPRGFHLTVQEVLTRDFTQFRTLNINSPLTTNPYGPRPIPANANILQLRDDGTGQGQGQFVGLSNFSLKKVQFFLGATHINIRSNGDGSTNYQPQSVYTNVGEEVRQARGNPLWQTFGNVTVTLPWKLQFAADGYARGGQPFDILTGKDDNGDGTVNDRPQFALPGAAPNASTIFRTPFGLLTTAGGFKNGVPQAPISRNLGELPWTFHLDANLMRHWKLGAQSQMGSERSITVNLRSSNFLNHTNVTADGNILGSPQFLTAITADPARRVEVGLRYSF